MSNKSIISDNIEVNLTYLKNLIGKSDDIIFREFDIGVNGGIKAFACFVDGMVDREMFDLHIIKALMIDVRYIEKEYLANNLEEILMAKVMSTMNSRIERNFDEVIKNILLGKVALFANGCSAAIIVDIVKWSHRAIEEPDTEVTVRGPREGFTETLHINKSLIRRIIKSPNLIFESFFIGDKTNTKINIAYLNDVADIKVVEEVRRRLSEIKTDAILESGYIEQFIEDNPFSLFATIGNSERPDKVAAKMLEGRVAILCEGTPIVLTVPYLFIESFQVIEDYNSRPFMASLIRIIRLIAFFITLALPALYIAIETFHQEMIPTVLILTAAASREGTPFPTFIEVVIMELFFQLLRESGIRMPRPLGQTVGFIGALVIGEAVVRAGIISAPMVIISALSAICSFILPPIVDATIFFRYILIILSSIAGLYGVIIGLLFMIVHLCSLKSFGAPFFSPLAPISWTGLKDSFIRVHLRFMNIKKTSGPSIDSKINDSELIPNKLLKRR